MPRSTPEPCLSMVLSAELGRCCAGAFDLLQERSRCCSRISSESSSLIVYVYEVSPVPPTKFTLAAAVQNLRRLARLIPQGPAAPASSEILLQHPAQALNRLPRTVAKRWTSSVRFSVSLPRHLGQNRESRDVTEFFDGIGQELPSRRLFRNQSFSRQLLEAAIQGL